MKKKIYITPNAVCIELSSYECIAAGSQHTGTTETTPGGPDDAAGGLSKSDFPWGDEEDW